MKYFESGCTSRPLKIYGMTFGKPLLPVLDSTTTLASLIGPEPWYIFDLLNLDTSFFNKPVMEWNSRDAFLSSKYKVQRQIVVNDSAEKGAKLTSNFTYAAKTSNSLQKTIQVVEKSHKDCRKF